MFRDHIPGDDKKHESIQTTQYHAGLHQRIPGEPPAVPGVIVTTTCGSPVHFTGIHELVLGVDEVCERISAPSAPWNPLF